MLDFATVRIGQEDSVFATSYGKTHLFLVADGAGGIAGGAEAADELVAFVANYCSKGLEPISPALLCEFLTLADEQIFKSARAGETTAVMAVVRGTRVVCASVGDSEAWVVEPSQLYELTEGQVRKPLLGSGVAAPKSLGVFTVSAGKLILGSDGLFKYAKIADIASIARSYSPSECMPRLLDLVRLPSGSYPDDIAIIICDIGGTTLRR